jgi:pterin-4a-carbinolamine dehydratase
LGIDGLIAQSPIYYSITRLSNYQIRREVLVSEKEPTYNEAQIAERLGNLPGWYYEDGWIRRVYKTDGWPTTLMLVNAVGYCAEAAYHHPDLAVTWGRVVVKLSTHSAGDALTGTPNKFVRSGDPR